MLDSLRCVQLLEAAKKGRHDDMRALLEDGADVQHRSEVRRVTDLVLFDKQCADV